MALYGNLHDYRFADQMDDIRGANLYSSISDEKLGKVDDVVFDNATGDVQYIVVDTGGWLSSNKFMVPAREVSVREDDENNDHYYVGLDKKQIERLPAYDEKHVERDEDFKDYEGRYKKAWTTDGDVLHEEGSFNIVTPRPDEISGGVATGDVSGRMNEADLSPRRIARDEPIFGATSESNSTDTARLVKENDRNPRMREPGPTGNTLGDNDSLIGRERMGSAESGSEGEGSGSESGRRYRPLIVRDYSSGTADLDPASELPEATSEQSRQSSSVQPYSSERFRRFQEKLRADREEIQRRRNERAA